MKLVQLRVNDNQEIYNISLMLYITSPSDNIVNGMVNCLETKLFVNVDTIKFGIGASNFVC